MTHSPPSPQKKERKTKKGKKPRVPTSSAPVTRRFCESDSLNLVMYTGVVVPHRRCILLDAKSLQVQLPEDSSLNVTCCRRRMATTLEGSGSSALSVERLSDRRRHQRPSDISTHLRRLWAWPRKWGLSQQRTRPSDRLNRWTHLEAAPQGCGSSQ